AGGPKPVGSALFRLASGFRGRELNMDIDEFASQVDAMKDAEAGLRKGALQGEWFSTHPFSPLRVKAVRAFFRSELFAKEAQSDAALEADVQSLMALMEPSYLDGKTDDAEAMRRLLFVAGLKVARAHDGIAEKEIEVFERLLGDDVFPDDLKPERADALIDERVPRVLELTTEGQRLQLIRDLGLIAHADGDFSLEERAVITDLAARLELEPLSVERTVGALGELD
ncbi:MAG: TerB family tellurite resistance protein, partial [Myxococcota bacterium]